MKQVFVHQVGTEWRVINKSTGDVIDIVPEVLIFNGVYKKYNNIKGWHGILSEEINTCIINLMRNDFYEVEFYPKKYYPRFKEDGKLNSGIKNSGYVKFNNELVFIRSSHNKLSPNLLLKLTATHKKEELDYADW